MILGRKQVFLLVAMVIAAVSLTGCGPELQPDKETLLAYVRSASVNGKVKRLWPDGQAYADKVLSARVKLNAELKPLEDYAAPLNILHRLHPDWRKADKLSTGIKEMDIAFNAGRIKRGHLAEELHEAIVNLPSDLSANEADKAALIKEIESNLLPNVNVLEQILSARLALYRKVVSCSEDFAENASGLSFKTGECASEVEQAYVAYETIVFGKIDAFFDHAKEAVAQSATLKQSIDKAKQRVLFDYHVQRMKYYRDDAEDFVKSIKTKITKLNEELDELRESESAKPDVHSKSMKRAEFLPKYIEHLEPKQKMYDARLDELLAIIAAADESAKID